MLLVEEDIELKENLEINAIGTDYKTVSEILGHANINITLNLYVHPNLKEKKTCIELISKILSNQIDLN